MSPRLIVPVLVVNKFTGVDGVAPLMVELPEVIVCAANVLPVVPTVIVLVLVLKSETTVDGTVPFTLDAADVIDWAANVLLFAPTFIVEELVSNNDTEKLVAAALMSAGTPLSPIVTVPPDMVAFPVATRPFLTLKS
jgi:hypothetical protein